MRSPRTDAGNYHAATWGADPSEGLTAFVRGVLGVAFKLPTRDPRLGTAGGEGWAIPAELAPVFAGMVREQSALLRHTMVAPVIDGHLFVPCADESNRTTSSLHAGFTFDILPENAGEAGVEIGTSHPVVGLVNPKLRRLAARWPVTSEAATDTVLDFGLRTLARALAAVCDDSIATAARTSPAAVEVDAELGQTAGTIVVENVANTIGRVPGESLRRGCWVCAPATLPQLVQLGAADAAPPAGLVGWWSNEETPGAGLLLCGRPVVALDHAPVAGLAGDLCFLDPTLVAVPRLEDVLSFAISGHSRFLFDEVELRLVVRWEAATALTNSILPNTGADPISPFVRLAARAA